MNTTLIGDPHGRVEELTTIMQGEGYFVALGDLGFSKHHLALTNSIDVHRCKVLFGNHDDYNHVHSAHSLGHFGMYRGMFFVRGAKSIDRYLRIEGRDWFREEELSYRQQLECLALYEKEKPDVVISHDCPQVIRERFFNITETSSTSILLQQLFNVHQPKRWLFGHHHKSMTGVIEGCEFRCLNEMEVCEVEIM